MFRHPVFPAAVALVCLLLGGRSALAGRVVYFEILLDGKIVLDLKTLDEGEAGPDAAWDYLKTRPLNNPADSFVLSPEETARLKAFKIVPAKDDPLKATLSGKVRIFCRYAGDARCDALRLVRKDEKAPWLIDPKQVDELAKKRTVDPARRVRAQVDAAAKAAAEKEQESKPPPKSGATKGPADQRTVAILLFEGVELLDFAGPAEVFIVAERGKAFRVVTMAETAKPLKTMGGITVTPDYALADAPAADIIVVPGGNLGAVGKSGREWLKKASAKAEITMSVCFGALLLADVGLLDGLEATSHRWALDQLKQAAPKCKVVSGKRYVDSGQIITTAGVTAGIDGALRIVERLRGKEAAQWAAEEWMEHRGEGAGK